MSGFVYFITAEPDEYVKIGWSLHSPQVRMRTLQTGCPEPLRLMAYAPATRDEERRLHLTFGELQYRGEWFYLQHKLQDFVRYLSDRFPRECESGASREVFEAGTWDVIITGFEHPLMPEHEKMAYRASAVGSLWHHLHDEMVA